MHNKLTLFLIDECNSKRKGGLYHKTQVQLAYNSNRTANHFVAFDSLLHTIGFLVGTMQSAQDVYETWVRYFCPDLLEGLKHN